MDILFCDLCNESVPAADLASGRAFRRGGRVICALCDAAMGGGGARAELATGAGSADVADPGDGARTRFQRAPRGLGVEWALALGAIGLTGLGWLAFDRIERTQLETARAIAMRAERIEDAAASIERRLRSERDSVAAELRERLDDLDERWSALESSGDNGGAAVIQSLAPRIDELGRQLQRIAANTDTAQGDRARLLELQDEVRADLGLVAQSILDVLSEPPRQIPGMPAIIGGADSGPTPGLEDVPAWMPLTSQLRADAAADRWDAVEALGETRDPRTAEFVATALADPDLFVRMAAARVLGELASLDGVPGLIDALGDPEPSVREASVLALRTITGQEFNYDPTEEPDRRKKRVDAWRKWWERTSSRS